MTAAHATPRPHSARRPVRGAGATASAARGFTTVELIAVMLIVAVLAVVALPRLSSLNAFDGPAWRDQVLAALRQAHALAQGHRRLVCATLADGEVRLAIAATHPATACSDNLAGPDGDARWAWDARGQTLSASPTATLYFQPDGRVTTDGAGTTTVTSTITAGSESAITLIGATGHVE